MYEDEVDNRLFDMWMPKPAATESVYASLRTRPATEFDDDLAELRRIDGTTAHEPLREISTPYVRADRAEVFWPTVPSLPSSAYRTMLNYKISTLEEFPWYSE